MDGTSAVRRPRTNTPRKNKVEKNKSPRKIKENRESEDEEEGKSHIKREAGGMTESLSRPQTADGTSGSQPQSQSLNFDLEPSLSQGPNQGIDHASPVPNMVKREPGSSSNGQYTYGAPLTPLESSTPASSFNSGDMMTDEMMNSFGMGHGITTAMYDSMESPLSNGFSMGMHMGMGDPFEGIWDGHTGHGVSGCVGREANDVLGEGGVLVKREPRWEESYRHE